MKYTKIYRIFLEKIKDYDLLYLMPEDSLEEYLEDVMELAIARFKYPRVPLTRDSGIKYFTEGITMAEVDMITFHMVSIWLERIVYALDHLDPAHQDKDYKKKWGKVLETFEMNKRMKRHMEGEYSKHDGSGKSNFAKLVGGVSNELDR